MAWIADLHIHSHFSMATSKECNPANLHRWAGLKGVSLVGTGDFTHPGWRQELRDQLEPAETGFYRLKEAPPSEIPGQPQIRFVVTGELSTIYKKDGRVRKVHHLLVFPSLEAADRLSAKLEALGMNIRSDGRPILGLDSYRLLQLTLECCPEATFIPAHIWTPHFSVFGSNSGFDAIEDCFGDLTGAITALETGLSSDPAMNWRWSALDRFRLVSNSDAHNPQNLAREANLFSADFSYPGLKRALEAPESGTFLGTLEFFPEEGKYHYDGHRNCELCWKPEETLVNHGICPRCGRKVTVGVLNRVYQLADRPEGFQLPAGKPFLSLIPLREIIGSALGVGSASRKTEQFYFELLKQFGPELTVLRETPIPEIARVGGPLIAEGIRRLRQREVEIRPGYDGEYGVINVLREDDRQALRGQAALFEAELIALKKKSGALVKSKPAASAPKADVPGEIQSPAALSEEQTAAIRSEERHTLIVAGPGAGKTRTLVERIGYFLASGVTPEEITAVTFTNKAAEELRNRIKRMLPAGIPVSRLQIGTFHGIGWKILNESPQPLPFKLLDESEAREILEDLLRQARVPISSREASLIICRIKNQYQWDPQSRLPDRWKEIYEGYQAQLAQYRRVDFDDILLKTIELWDENPEWLQPMITRFRCLLIDEFQDLNETQYRLLQHWSRSSEKITAIGDPNQAIYGFRGADPRFFELLRTEAGGTDYQRLTCNYRSTSVLVAAANQLVDPEFQQRAAALDPAGKIIHLQAASEKSAARAVTAEIISQLGGSTMLSAHGQARRRGYASETGNFGLSDFAILFRTGRQADSFERALAAEGLPYRVAGQTGTFDAAVVKEFMAFFRMLLEPGDPYLLRSALRYPRWELSAGELARVMNGVHSATVAEAISTDLLTILAQAGWEDRIAAKLECFVNATADYRQKLDRSGPELVQDWMERMNLSQDEELSHLLRISEEYPDLESMIRFLPLATEADISRRGRNSTGTEAITLATIHASKGLEFPVVFLAGAEEGLLPLGEKWDEATLAEEQRLFYVGITRARQQLYLVNSTHRSRSGERVEVEPSRFINRIPPMYLLKKEWAERTRIDQLELFPSKE